MPRKVQLTAEEIAAARDVAKTTTGPLPELTPQIAAEVAKLLHVGCPQLRAVRYAYPNVDVDRAKAILQYWQTTPLIKQALEQLMGGAWLDMDPEKRYALALDKHLGEMAFYLWSNNFCDIEYREGIEKMKIAREVLTQKVRPSTDDSNPLEAFARFAMDLLADRESKRASKSSIAPAFQGPVMPKIQRGIGPISDKEH